jgi:hypothetical protein
MIADIINSKLFKANEIAKVAGYSRRSIYIINKNLRYFSFTKAPLNGIERPRSVISSILDALRNLL